MNVPKTRSALCGSKIPLHQDRTRSRALDLKDKIRHLDSARLTLVTNTENRLWVVLVGEEVTTTHDERPDFSSNLDVGRNVDGGGNEVSTVVKVEDLVGGYRVHSILHGSSVIGNTVTNGTKALDADKGASWKRLVLRTRTGEEMALRVEERSRLLRRVESLLDAGVLVSDLPVTLCPRLDEAATFDDGRAGRVLDSHRAATEVDVVNDQSATSSWVVLLVLLVGHLDTDWSVDKCSIHENDGANSLSRSVGHVDTDTAVVDVDTLESPDPVPVHEDGSLTAVEGHVAAGELLVSEKGTIITTVENQVSHESTRTVVHEDTDLLGSRTGNHVEDDVLERGGLSDLPVNTGTSSLRHASKVNDKVTNLAEEVVLVSKPIVSVGFVWVRVNDGHTDEVSSSLESRRVHSVTNHMGVVVLDKWSADEIRARRKVDDGRSDRGRITTKAAARTSCYGGIDCDCRVS